MRMRGRSGVVCGVLLRSGFFVFDISPSLCSRLMFDCGVLKFMLGSLQCSLWLLMSDGSGSSEVFVGAAF